MSSQPTARSVGWFYLLTMLPAPLNLVYLPSRFLVAGDAAATAQRITDAEMLYRLCALAGLWSSVMFIFVAFKLANLFQNVDRRQGRLLVALVLVSSSIGLVNLINELAPLVLLSGADYFAAFSKPQIDALVMGFLRLRGIGLGIDSVFWGLWLLPFGLLVMKSGFMPRWIGILLIIGCVGYLIQALTAILWPAYVHTVFTATIPLVGPGEISAIIWLIARGNRVPIPVESAT
jgi:hypothetical protein